MATSDEHTSGRVHIPASADAVREVIAAVADYPAWADGVTAVDVVESDDTGRPSVARFEVSSGFVKGSYTIRYDWSLADEVSWSLVESSLLKRLDGRYRLAEADGGTEVSYELAAVPSMPLIGALRRKAEQQLVTTALTDLARRTVEVDR